ncbi:hypothetical protein D3C74_500290 [compost metagenome]
MLVQVQVVDRLQNLVREFGERYPAVQPAGDNILGQHRVDAEVFAEIAQELNYVNILGPVVVVD